MTRRALLGLVCGLLLGVNCVIPNPYRCRGADEQHPELACKDGLVCDYCQDHKTGCVVPYKGINTTCEEGLEKGETAGTGTDTGTGSGSTTGSVTGSDSQTGTDTDSATDTTGTTATTMPTTGTGPSTGSETGPMGCTGDTECSLLGEGTDYCLDSKCVACIEDVHCTTEDAAACDPSSNTCVPCSTNDECAGVDGLGVCSGGVCVECTSNDDCAGKVCSTLTSTCTDQDPESALACGPCEADAQCAEGRLCVEQVFMGTSVGHFCFWRKDATNGPNGDCLTEPPFANEVSATSVDNVPAEMCTLRQTTCVARADRGEGCGADEDCGFDMVPDGVCKSDICTTPCTMAVDCAVGKTCTTEDFCQ